MIVPLCAELSYLKWLDAFLQINTAQKARKLNIYSRTVALGQSSAGSLVYAHEFTGRKSTELFLSTQCGQKELHSAGSGSAGNSLFH